VQQLLRQPVQHNSAEYFTCCSQYGDASVFVTGCCVTFALVQVYDVSVAKFTGSFTSFSQCLCFVSVSILAS